MKAIMLAAGVGARLSQNDESYLPKCLLQFEGQSLLARHIDHLKAHQIESLTLVVGYRANDIYAELANIGATDFVETVSNPQFRDGSIVSLSCAEKTMRSGEDILFMDADVLYHGDLIGRLANAEGSCILFDPDFEPGDEPVKLCQVEGEIVEFRKIVEIEHDTVGEWPGFVRWSPSAASEIADVIDRIVATGAIEQPYEEAFREFLLGTNGRYVVCANIAGLPWIEIDFPEDLERARAVILPAISA